ncbi:MAG TPA: magnesium/cobalt transporter CorA [Anaerolineales bacterium]|jgi:magnesium transporter
MIRSLYYVPGKPVQTDLTPKQYLSAKKSRRGLLWVDFSGESPEVAQPILESFGFHRLAIEDALQETHSPKVDDWGEYIYVVLNYIRLRGEAQESWETEVDELDTFLGHNYVITHHDFPLPALDLTWSACQRDERNLQEGADHLFYRMVDNLVADYMPIVEKIDLEIDKIEDQLFNRPTPRTLEHLFTLKRVLLAMRRILLPQREVLNRLARDDYRVIDPHDRIFFRDIYDHIVRLHDLNETLRDLVGGVLDTYLSVVNNRMNEIMKTLTTITTLFMPITFITGFFGMNFFQPVSDLGRWTGRDAFELTLLLLAIFPVLMYIWMRRRTWL